MSKFQTHGAESILNMTRRPDPTETRARELSLAAGVDPDSRIAKPGSARGMPAWCDYRDAARAEQNKREAEAAAAEIVNLRPQEPQYQNSPLKVFGEHDENTLAQMRNCMAVGNAVSGVICADGHLGYACQPVGGVVAYEKQISISGVGWDISCGNAAIRLDTKYDEIKDSTRLILDDITRSISFGVGRVNDEPIEHAIFDDEAAWQESGMEDYRKKAVHQLGTVGGGNHYIDLFRDDDGFVWIGVHFGSRGLGHTTATRYVNAAGGKDGVHAAPSIVDDDSEIGVQYLAAMHLAGRYAYAGRDAVVERVRQIIGGNVTYSVHANHNFAWKETHDGREVWVVRKGATPAFPGQKGFVGGSMGDDAVIIEGIDSPEAKASLYSTVHGAGRIMGRKQALRTFTRTEMDAWLQQKGVAVSGGDLDESPQAYRRLPEVLKYHSESIRILHTLHPFAVAMAGRETFDPWKD